MVGPSKILTVSYGTFSCTLEGFDDPFSTMKAIAEYFRDLAADDRYFGAEPPQPDAAMLHRIAEREVQRRVEAKVQENTVILRAGESAAPMAAAAPMTVAPATAAAPAAAPVAPAPVPPQVAPSYTPSAEAPATESVAARLQRLRAAAAMAAVPAAEVVEDEPAAAPAPQPVFVQPEPVVEPAPLAAQVEPEPEEVYSPISALSEFAAPAAEVVSFELPEAPSDVVTDVVPQAWRDAPVAETVETVDESALLAAVAAEAETVDEGAETVADFAPAIEDAAEEPAFDMSVLSLDTPVDVAEAATPVVELVADDADDDVLGMVAQLVSATPAPVVEEAAIEVEDLAVEAETEEPLVEVVAEAANVDVEPEVAEEAAAEDEFFEETLELEAAEVEDEPEAEETVFAPLLLRPTDPIDAEPVGAEPVLEATETEAEPQRFDMLQRARARAIRVRREMADQPEAAAEETEEPVLSPTAEAELERELEELRGETPRAEALAEATEEVSVQRLIDQTNTEMEGPENRRRLSAIAHLKAAVAATVADRAVGTPTASEESRLSAYREDLDRVVRPRRPTSSGASGELTIPPSSRPAPLVLVSSQRIDRPAPTMPTGTVTPVRPRRVPTTVLPLVPENLADEHDDEDDIDDVLDGGNVFSDASGFAEFAERLGATELPEMLEAAAAYAAVVEGRPHLTRPQMLRQVLDAIPADEAPSREDVLRSFGTLLREGRIEKVRRGQFALREDARYLDAGRRIAQ